MKTLAYSCAHQYKIAISIIVLRIGQIDTKNETFYAEFLLEATWLDKFDSETTYDVTAHFNPSLTVENCIGEPLQDIWYTVKPLQSSLRVISERRRVRGLFWQKFNFQHFPIDVQTLHLEISTPNALERVLLVEAREKPNFLNPKAFMDEREWTLCHCIKSAEQERVNDISKETHASYVLSMNVARMPSYYVYNAFLLVLLITTVGLARFSVACDLPQVRLILDGGVILTLITFKWIVMGNLPQISCLTSLDKYMLFSIAFITSQCIYDAVIGIVSVAMCPNPFYFYDVIAFFVSALIILVANVVLGVWACVFAFKTRSKLFKEDSEQYSRRNFFSIYSSTMKAYGSGGNEVSIALEQVESVPSGGSSSGDEDSIYSKNIRL